MQGGVIFCALGLLICGVGGILVIVALATNNWVTYLVTKEKANVSLPMDASAGLFKHCITMGEGSFRRELCDSSATFSYIHLGHNHAVKAMTILGMVGTFPGILLALVGLINHSYRNWIRAASCFALVSGLLVIIGAIVYAISLHLTELTNPVDIKVILDLLTEYYDQDDFWTNTEPELSWSFDISVAGGTCIFLSSILTLIGAQLIKPRRRDADSTLGLNTMDLGPDYVVFDNPPHPYYQRQYHSRY